MINVKRFPRYVNSSQVKDIQPIEGILYNPLTYLQKELTPSEKLVLNYLLSLSRKYPDVYAKHETIANNIGICRKTATRSIHRLRELGLVNYLFRANHSSLYRPSSFLLMDWVRDSLKGMLPALNWISSVLLLAGTFAFSCQTEMSHDVNKNRFIYLKSVANYRTISNSIKQRGCLEAEKKKGIRVMNPRIEKLRQLLALELQEAEALSKYPDWVLEKAIKRVDKIKEKEHKTEYLFALCESELKPKPKAEAAYTHLKGKYPASDNALQIKPPSHKAWKAPERIFTHDELLTEESVRIKKDKWNNSDNPFAHFAIADLDRLFKKQQELNK